MNATERYRKIERRPDWNQEGAPRGLSIAIERIGITDDGPTRLKIDRAPVIAR